MLKRSLAALCLAALVLVSGCGKKKDAAVTPDANPGDKTVESQTNNDADNKTNQDNKDNNSENPQKPVENQNDPVVVEGSKYINPLTGLGTTEQISKNRPVAIMMNNIKQAMPQVGIGKADIIYEVLEEGGITRLMAVYQSYEDIPEFGSVRSSRDYYIDLADAHDAIYVHCGGSTYAKTMLANRKTNNIDGLYASQFYRSAERRKTMAYEHTLMISGKGIKEAASSKNYRTTSNADQPLEFSEDYNMNGAKAAASISVPFSLALKTNPYALSKFEYDDERGLYLKSHYGTKHIDGANGEQLAFTNVITLECKQYVIPGDELGCLAVNFVGEGKGLYAVDGKIKPIVWKKASRTSNYTLYEEDGTTPLELKPGKSYIGIVPTGTTVSYN